VLERGRKTRDCTTASRSLGRCGGPPPACPESGTHVENRDVSRIDATLARSASFGGREKTPRTPVT